MTKKLETLGAVHTHTHTHTSILNNEIIKFNIENKAKLIAVFGGRFQPYLCCLFVGLKELNSINIFI